MNASFRILSLVLASLLSPIALHAQWSVNLDSAIQGLNDLADAADRPGNDPDDKEVKDLASRAADLAKQGKDNGLLTVSPRDTGRYGATARVPKGIYRPGWETPPESVEVASLAEKELSKIYKKLRGPNGECEQEAKDAAALATLLTLAHEMFHVDQDQAVAGQPGKDPIEKDAYKKEKKLADWLKKNRMMHLKVREWLCGWIKDIENAITASC